MKKKLILLLILPNFLFAQFNNWQQEQEIKFTQAKTYYQAKRVSLAFPLFYELQQRLTTTDLTSQAIKTQEINFYTLACRLMLNDKTVEKQAIDFIENEQNNARTQMLSYHLAEFYFRNSDLENALAYYERTTEANLMNDEIATLQFHAGYIYFNNKNYEKAKPYLNAIRLNPKDPNYYHANYYYGFMALQNNEFADATECFNLVETDGYYGQVVPFYLTQIYYLTGQKDKAINYAKERLKYVQPFYDAEMKQLVGHALFEKKEFTQALPYLEQYMSQAPKVRREDIYELSFCYYQAKNFDKAIDGFKQLSGKEDSLSQNAMYLLADAYLQTNQKEGARQAFLFCSQNANNSKQRDISSYNYAKLSYELGYQDIALSQLNNYISNYPTGYYSTEAKEIMVQLLARSNNYKDALSLLEKIENPTAETQKYFARILFGRSQELISDGYLTEANEYLSKSLIATGNAGIAPLAKFWKGEIALRNKNYDEAINFTTEYLKQSTTFYKEANPANAKYNLGQAYLNKQLYTNALKSFDEVCSSLNSKSNTLEQDAFLRAADCMFMLKSYPKALEKYTSYVNNNGNSSDYAFYQKAIITGISNPTEKINQLKQFTNNYPASNLKSEVNLEIANAYIAQEKFNEAIPFLKNLISNNETKSFEPQALLKLGIIYSNIKNNAEALAQFNTLVNNYPYSTEAEDAGNYVKEIAVEMGDLSSYENYNIKTGKTVNATAIDSLTWRTVLTKYETESHEAALPLLLNYLQKFPNGAYILEANYFTAAAYEDKKDLKSAAPYFEYVADKAPNKYAERSLYILARFYYFDEKDYLKAKNNFIKLNENTTNVSFKNEALRGLLRCNYQFMAWAEAVPVAEKLLADKNTVVDDKILSYMVLGKAAYSNNDFVKATNAFKQVLPINKAAFAAEARYYIAEAAFKQNKFKEAEKLGLEVINKSGSYSYWITKAYILLADIYTLDKDYFNAKATLESVVANALDEALKSEAQTKLNNVKNLESQNGKIEK
jgi:TolA-binding protein